MYTEDQWLHAQYLPMATLHVHALNMRGSHMGHAGCTRGTCRVPALCLKAPCMGTSTQWSAWYILTITMYILPTTKLYTYIHTTYCLFYFVWPCMHVQQPLWLSSQSVYSGTSLGIADTYHMIIIADSTQCTNCSSHTYCTLETMS